MGRRVWTQRKAIRKRAIKEDWEGVDFIYKAPIKNKPGLYQSAAQVITAQTKHMQTDQGHNKNWEIKGKHKVPKTITREINCAHKILKTIHQRMEGREDGRTKRKGSQA